MISKYEMDNIKDTHLVGPEEEYNVAERDIATLINEVELLEARLEVSEEHKEQLIKEVNSARAVYKRLLDKILRDFMVVDFEQLHDRVAVLERIARASSYLNTGETKDVEVTAKTELGEIIVGDIINSLEAYVELQAAKLDV